jgi:CO/xanthine dehydrogenase Mo-binding subunit
MSVSRRDFLKSSGALIVSFSAASVAGPFAMGQGPFDTHRSHIDPNKLDSWIAITSDGSVTGLTGKCDFGQGMFTAQTQLVAEELCVPISRVKLIQCDTSVAPDQGTTSGSQSTPTNFNSANLAQAAATAREALINMAAQHLGESADQLSVADGVVTGKIGRITYAELIGSKRFNLPLSATAKRRSPAQWTVLGKPVPSQDRIALMTGRFEFVHNVRVPGMLHGRVVRPPEVGATVAAVDENSVRQISGLVKVMRRNNFVGVVAEKQSQAVQAARQLKVRWNTGTGLPSQNNTFYRSLRKQPSRDVLVVDSKDVERQLAAASTVVRASYAYPFQMHGSVGTSCAVADVKPDQATVWSATQSVYPTRSIVAKILGVGVEGVRVIFVRGSGCYGLNGADTVSFDAAVLSQAVGRPVRVQLSREDEMVWENFGSACVVEQRAGIDHKGAIVAWDCENWVASRGNRPGYDHPGNVITGLLLGYEPETVTSRAATEPTGELRNRDNAAPSYLAGCINGKCGGAGTVRSERVLSHTVPSPFFTGPLRSPLRIQNTFAHECFMDELSASAKADPVAFRLQHLRDARLIAVLKSAAEVAKWKKRTPQQLSRTRTGAATGRGIACVAYEGNNGYAALVAEVNVDLATGRVRPTRFIMASDCGPISNPDGLRNQIEGGVLQGMSRALMEEVTWDDKRVTSKDWETYASPYLDLGLELPTIEISLLNRTDVPATGAGETVITVVPSAIGNAIFDATGVRLREVPFTAERVRAALSALRGTER